MKAPIRVMVVDDSALVRMVLSDILQADPDIEVVGTANDGAFALQKIAQLDPDVISLDVEMPNKDGLETLREIMATHPTPVVMCSSKTTHGAELTFKALEEGAIDFVPKPSHADKENLEEVAKSLIRSVKTAAVCLTHRKVESRRAEKAGKPLAAPRPEKVQLAAPVQAIKAESPAKGELFLRMVAVGCSTGGPEALRTFLSGFPKKFEAPILVVQHMPEGFTKAFAERLNGLVDIPVKLAEHGEQIFAGQVYIAPGNHHMKIRKEGALSYIELDSHSGLVNGHRPSVDVLFKSAAASFRGRVVSVLMTGMGNDGAEGMRALHDCGGPTAVQDEKTCVVFGMPREAIKAGGAQHVFPLEMLSGWAIGNIESPKLPV